MDKMKIATIIGKAAVVLFAIIVIVIVLLGFRYKDIVSQNDVVLLDVWNGDIYHLGEYKFNLKEERKKELEEEVILPPSEAVSGVIKYQSDACSDEFPLHIRLTNHTKRVVYSIEWILHAHEKDRSSNYVVYNERENYSDWIILPKDKNYPILYDGITGFCRKMPKLIDDEIEPKDLVWELKITDVEYK